MGHSTFFKLFSRLLQVRRRARRNIALRSRDHGTKLWWQDGEFHNGPMMNHWTSTSWLHPYRSEARCGTAVTPGTRTRACCAVCGLRWQNRCGMASTLLPPRSKINFTRWRSMKDRFKRVMKKEGQSRSGAAASRTSIYKYNRILQFLRPVLESRETHSSTREPVRPSGAVLRESPADPSQPSHSESRSAPPQSGEPAAGPSHVPLAEASVAPSFGSSLQRQRASDRPLLPEFLHLSTVFQNCFKALGDRMDTALPNIDRRLQTMESELSRPAKHFFSAIEKGMVEHLTPELQISVMQACNNAYVTALQQARVMQSATTMPAVPSLATMAPTPAAEHQHRAPRAEGHRRHRHHRTEPQSSAPARPSRAQRQEAEPHPEGERRKRKKTRTTTAAMAAPRTSTPSTQPGSTRSRSSHSQSTLARTLVVPPPSPPALALSPPSTGWTDVGIPSSVLKYGGSSPSSSSSFSSTHTQTGGYQSPFVADVNTP
ncbi:uncharacterized protein [Ranitomeya imitator]|uniref:uncharacterized protein isoform X1 n=1 Tax=Ranitomeya imitator TaxID=111125 RepID=UPI0037E8C9FD